MAGLFWCRGMIRRKPAPSTCPDWYGGTNFMSPSFDKTTNMFYLTVRETCARFIRRAAPDDVKVGDRTMGGQVAPLPDRRWGAVRAIDATTGDQKWDVKYEGPGWAGVIATSGGVVFSSDHQGTFLTIDAKSGKVLYTFPTGGTGYAPPTTYLAGWEAVRRDPVGIDDDGFCTPLSSMSSIGSGGSMGAIDAHLRTLQPSERSEAFKLFIRSSWRSVRVMGAIPRVIPPT